MEYLVKPTIQTNKTDHYTGRQSTDIAISLCTKKQLILETTRNYFVVHNGSDACYNSVTIR
jgi:hypothetical protein